MVWLADDVLYAALADDPEHTMVSLPSDVKWTEMNAFPLENGGLRFFLNSTNQNEDENDDTHIENDGNAPDSFACRLVSSFFAG